MEAGYYWAKFLLRDNPNGMFGEAPWEIVEVDTTHSKVFRTKDTGEYEYELFKFGEKIECPFDSWEGKRELDKAD